MSPEWLPEGSRFAVLASGSGTNLQALLDAYSGHVAVVAGDKEGAYAFERARRAGGGAAVVPGPGGIGVAQVVRRLTGLLGRGP